MRSYLCLAAVCFCFFSQAISNQKQKGKEVIPSPDTLIHLLPPKNNSLSHPPLCTRPCLCLRHALLSFFQGPEGDREVTIKQSHQLDAD